MTLRLWRPSGPEVVLACGSAAACVAAIIPNALAAEGPIVCPFRLVTGAECPACGSVRAWVAAMNGDLEAAIDHNPMAVLLLIGLALALLLRSVAPSTFGAVMTAIRDRAVMFATIVVVGYATVGATRVLA